MVLYGASGHCRVVIDIVEALGYPIDFIVDDDPNISELLGYEVRRNTREYEDLIITIGQNWTRKKVFDQITAERYIKAVHPTAIVSPRAQIGEGSVVIQGAIIQSCAVIGKHCIINTGASVGHDVRLGDFVHVASHATITGGVTIGEGTWIGAGSVIRQGVHIGAWSMIGAGSVVVDDIPDGVVAFGNKCVVRHKNEFRV